MAVLCLLGDGVWQLSSLGPQWNLVAALPQRPRGGVSSGLAPGGGAGAAGEACRSPAGSFARFSHSCLPGGLVPGKCSPGFGVVGVLVSELQRECPVTSFNVGIVPFPGGDLMAGLPSPRSSYSSAGRRCRCGQGSPLGGRACACCGAGASGNRAALQACWEPLGPGGRSLGSVHGAYCVSLQAGRPAGPHYPPRSPLELGRGGDQADPRRVPEPRDQCGLRSEVRAL